MSEASRTDRAGDGTGATRVREESAVRDEEAVKKESSAAIYADTCGSRRSSMSSTTAAAATALVDSDGRRKKEGGRGGKSKGMDKAKGDGRLRSERSSSLAIPAALTSEFDKRTSENSPALLASPSAKMRDTKSTRSSKAKTRESGEIEKEGRRRKSSSKTRASSDNPSSTTPVRKPSKDDGSTRRRTRLSSSHSPSVVDAQRQVQEPPVAHIAHVQPSAPDPKRRKRVRSSGTISVDDDADDDAEPEPTPPMMQQSEMHSGGATTKRTLCCPNATSSTTGKEYEHGPSKSGEVNLTSSHDIPTAVAKPAAEPEPAPDYNGYPAEVVSQRNNSDSGTEPSDSGEEGGRTATEEGGHSVRRNDSARRRRDGTTQEKIKRKGKSNLTEGGVSRRHNSGSSSGKPNRGNRTARVATRIVVDPSPSPALGVKVIDEGATKQLVLTADDNTASRGKPESSGERSTGGTKTSTRVGGSQGRSCPAQPFDIVHPQHEEKKKLHRRDRFAGEEERSRAFRENFAKAVLATGGDDAANVQISTKQIRNSTDAFIQGVEDDETTTRASYQQKTPAGRPPPLEAATKKHPEPTHHNHRDEPQFERRRIENVSASIDAACTSSPTESQLMEPSFSVVQTDLHHHHNNNHNSPSPPTTSSSSSSFLGRPNHERTAKYVAEQASFHADISNHYVDVDSPPGKEGGEGEQEGAVNGNRPRVTSNSGMVMTTERPAAESFSCNSVFMVEDSGPGKNIERENDPAVLSLRKSREIFGRSSHNGREHDRPDVHTTTAQGVRAFPTPQVTTIPEHAPRPVVRCEAELDVSSSMPSTVLQASSLVREGGDVCLGPDQQQHVEPRVTPPLSQDRGKFTRRSTSLVGRNVEDDGGLAGDMVHFRIDASRHLVSGERPALFFLRPNESLAVTRIEGAGRLLVTLREEAGAGAVVVIDGATVHDSAAHFGHAAIQVGWTFSAGCTHE